MARVVAELVDLQAVVPVATALVALRGALRAAPVVEELAQAQAVVPEPVAPVTPQAVADQQGATAE